MAKLQDKFFNRVIEGDLELGQNEKNQVSALVVPAIAGKDVEAKTLSQSEANWKGSNIDFNAPSGLTITNTYNRLEVINNILHLVINFKVQNSTGESKTFEAVDLVASIPHKYAEQVVDVNGNSVADTWEDGNDYIFITGEPAMAIKNNDTYNGEKLSGKVFMCNRKENTDYLSVFAALDSPLTMADGDYIFFTGRIALTLI